jgi:hypothetical protein
LTDIQGAASPKQAQTDATEQRMAAEQARAEAQETAEALDQIRRSRRGLEGEGSPTARLGWLAGGNMACNG